MRQACLPVSVVCCVLCVACECAAVCAAASVKKRTVSRAATHAEAEGRPQHRETNNRAEKHEKQGINNRAEKHEKQGIQDGQGRYAGQRDSTGGSARLCAQRSGTTVRPQTCLGHAHPSSRVLRWPRSTAWRRTQRWQSVECRV
jgi:hypothetical protein